MEHTIEEGFEKLEGIIGQMESQEISLDDAFDLYKAGMEELKYCNSKINDTKKAVMAYQENGSFEVFEEDE